MIRKYLFRVAAVGALAALLAGAASADHHEAGEAPKPFLVKMHADWNSTCKMLTPTWETLETRHAADTSIVILDMTTKELAAQSEQRAKELGIHEFYEANVKRIGTIGILMPDGSPVEIFKGRLDHRDYTAAVEKAKAQIASPGSEEAESEQEKK